MKNLLISFLLFSSTVVSSQSVIKQFYKLSRPERHWTIAHIFKAKKAFRITKNIEADVDSIKRSGVIGADNNGGRLDAFKHAYWMASVANGIGKKKALKLGVAHEKGNYIQFKKHQLEESILPDSVSSAMDLHNNNEGVKTIAGKNDLSKTDIQQLIFNVLRSGQLAVIKKDAAGNFLTCEGKVVQLAEWYGKWNIPKCIVASGE